jgi:GntR family transcriptional repressor for pyruvate dehydrogenase complex
LQGKQYGNPAAAQTNDRERPVTKRSGPVDIGIAAKGGEGTPKPKQTLSAGIVAQIRDALFARQLAPGHYIGSEAAIAQDFGVSRMAARDAIRALVAQGIVTVSKGVLGGVRIATGAPELIADVLAVQLRLLGVSLADLIEAQVAMEAATAELAAEHTSAADVALLRKMLGQAAERVEEPIGFTEEIVRFHVALAETSGNIVLSTLLRGVLRVLIDTYGRNTTVERARGVLHTYQSVVDAVEARDGEAARVLMRSHLRKVGANLIAANALAATGVEGDLSTL